MYWVHHHCSVSAFTKLRVRLHACKQQISRFTYSFVHHGALFVDLLSLPDEQIRTCILSEFNYLKFTLNMFIPNQSGNIFKYKLRVSYVDTSD